MEEGDSTSRREKRALLMAFLQSDAFGPASPVIESPPTGPGELAKLATSSSGEAPIEHSNQHQQQQQQQQQQHHQAPSRCPRRSADTRKSSSHHRIEDDDEDDDADGGGGGNDSLSTSSSSRNVSLKEGKRLFDSRRRSLKALSRGGEKSSAGITTSSATAAEAAGAELVVEWSPRQNHPQTDVSTPSEAETVLHTEEKTSFLSADDSSTLKVSDGGDAHTFERKVDTAAPAASRSNLEGAHSESPQFPSSSDNKAINVDLQRPAAAIKLPAPGGTDLQRPAAIKLPAPGGGIDLPAPGGAHGAPSNDADSSSSSEGLSDCSVPRTATAEATTAASSSASKPATVGAASPPGGKKRTGGGGKHVPPVGAPGGGGATRRKRTFSPHISDLPQMYREHHLQRQQQNSVTQRNKNQIALDEACKELTFSPRITTLPDMYHRDRDRDRDRDRQQRLIQQVAGGGGNSSGSGGGARRQRAISEPPASSSSCLSSPKRGGTGGRGPSSPHSFSSPTRANGAGTGGSPSSLSFSSPMRANPGVKLRGGKPFHERAMAWQSRLDMRMRDLADAGQRERDSECSFRPRILNRSRNVANSSLASGVAKRKYRANVVERYVEERDRKLVESCTFAPKINPKSRQLAEKWRRISYQCHHSHAHVANRSPLEDDACSEVAGSESNCSDGASLSDGASMCSCACSDALAPPSSVAGASVASSISPSSSSGVAPLPVEFMNQEELELEQATFAPATNKVPGKMKRVSKYLEMDVASRLYEKSPFTPRRRKKHGGERPKTASSIPEGRVSDKKSATKAAKGGGNWSQFMTRYEESLRRREVNRKLLSQREANPSRPVVNPKSEAMAARRGKSFTERLDVHSEARAKMNEKIAAVAAKETPFQPQLCANTATILQRAEHDVNGNMMIRRRVSQFDEDLTFAPKVNVPKGRKISRELTSYLGLSPHERLAAGARPFSPSRRASKVKADIMRVVGKKSKISNESKLKSGGAILEAISEELINSEEDKVNPKSKSPDKHRRQKVAATDETGEKQLKITPSSGDVAKHTLTDAHQKEIIPVRVPQHKGVNATVADKESATAGMKSTAAFDKGSSAPGVKSAAAFEKESAVFDKESAVFDKESAAADMKSTSVDVPLVDARSGAADAKSSENDIDTIQRKSICALAPRMKVPSLNDLI